jgi:hypothetical protein
MAQNATININAVDNTRGAFLAVQRNIQAVERQSASVSRNIMRTGLGIVGASGVGLMVSRQIREVVKNIESIPGIPDNVAASVMALRERFAELSIMTQGWIASTISGFQRLGQNIGIVVGAMVYGVEAAADALDDIERAQSDALNASRAEALERQLKPLREELARVRDAAAVAMAPFSGAALRGQQQIDALRERMGGLMADLARTDDQTETGLRRQIELYREMRVVASTLHRAEEERKRTVRDAGKLMAEGFEEAVFSGKKLSDVIKQLGQDLMRLVFRNMITTPLANALTSGFGRILGFAGGGIPPTGRASIVGEKGPELFVPGTSGRIVPNNELAKGSSGNGSTYYIDARGADQTGLARLEGLIRQTQASIKPIALGAVMDARMRGGALA